MKIRKFKTGATRNTNEDKLEIHRFLCAECIKIWCEYMHKHRKQGKNIREPDNWKKKIPNEELLASATRHWHDWWLEDTGFKSREGLNDALCGVIFNTLARLHSLHEKGRNTYWKQP